VDTEAWEYQSGKLISIETPFPETDTDVEKDLKNLGHIDNGIILGTKSIGGFGATVYEHNKPSNVKGYRWLVLLAVGDYGEYIFISQLPDLIAFLKDCSNIAIAVQFSQLDEAGLYKLVERLAQG
jgi:hypothetical protein